METNQQDNRIEIERQFDVDVNTLFEAWTQPEHLKKWWHPMGESLTDVTNDLKEGGAVEYHVGQVGLQITGTYSEVVPNEKLVYTWVWNMSDEGSESGYTLRIGFAGEGDGSKLHVIQEGFSGPELLKPHQDGWEKGLDDLGNYLSSLGQGNDQGSADAAQTPDAGQNELQSAEGMTDRSGGYNESPEQAKVGGA